MVPSNLPDFDIAELALSVEALDESQLTVLPFGAIRMSREGIVEIYSAKEAQLAGNLSEPTVGRHFFSEIAPCMDTPGMRGRIERALDAGTLDLELLHIGDFSDRGRTIRIRAQSSVSGGYWLFMKRD